MNWICKFLGDHKPNRDKEHYRERHGEIDDHGHWDHHFERYTTCVRCEKEIIYVRFFNFWRTKADHAKGNFGEWLDE